MADHIRATEGRYYHTRGMDSSHKETQWVYHSHHYGTDPLGHDNIVEKWATHGNTASIGHDFLKEASGIFVILSFCHLSFCEEEVMRAMNFKMVMRLFTDIKSES